MLFPFGVKRFGNPRLPKPKQFNSAKIKMPCNIGGTKTLHDGIVLQLSQRLRSASIGNVLSNQHKLQSRLGTQNRPLSHKKNPRPKNEGKNPLHFERRRIRSLQSPIHLPAPSFADAGFHFPYCRLKKPVCFILVISLPVSGSANSGKNGSLLDGVL